VTFCWKNYARACEPATITLKAEEFIRRFLLHVLPKGFVKVRHFGFPANRCRRENVVLCRKLLAANSTVLPDLTPPRRHSDEPGTAAVDRCPRCKLGSMRMLEILLAQADVMAASGVVQLDTS
jgi:Putative transposase